MIIRSSAKDVQEMNGGNHVFIGRESCILGILKEIC